MYKEQTANSIQIEYGKENLKLLLSQLLKQEFSNYIIATEKFNKELI